MENNSSTKLPHLNVEHNERKLSDYTLIRVIGVGTFGKVYLATMKSMYYAIKMYKKA